jgi:hypothetical protein
MITSTSKILLRQSMGKIIETGKLYQSCKIRGWSSGPVFPASRIASFSGLRQPSSQREVKYRMVSQVVAWTILRLLGQFLWRVGDTQRMTCF